MNASRESMHIVVVGHVDHGKSTLVGRLMADTGSLPQGKLEAVRARCRRNARPFEYAFLLDALRDEQSQGVTIDSARCFFKSARRDYIIIDAPGHIEFVKNMVTGAARAQAALLVIDAAEGVRENSRRHGALLGMLGIRQVAVVINKMDLADYARKRFQDVADEYRRFLDTVDVRARAFIPAGARDGQGVARASDRMNWYRGPTVLEALDGFTKDRPPEDLPLRMVVQDVYKFTERGDDRRIIAGRMESGKLRVGDRVVFYPSSKTSHVRSIETHGEPAPASLSAGRPAGVTLAEQVFITRGEIMAHQEDAPLCSTRFRANLVWLGKAPLRAGIRYTLKLGAGALPVEVEEVVRVLEATEDPARESAAEVRRHEVAEVILRTTGSVAFDTVDRIGPTSRFVIVDGYDISGGGIVREALLDDQEALREGARVREFEWTRGHVTRADRAVNQGYPPVLVLFTGDAGVGKHRLARALELRLFQDGFRVYLLDGRNVLLGVDADLAARRFAPEEVVRRYGEVANLFLDAGLVVISTTNTIALSDHQAVRTQVSPAPVLSVHIDPELFGGNPANTDIRLLGTEPDTEAVDRIVAQLTRLGVERLRSPSGAHSPVE